MKDRVSYFDNLKVVLIFLVVLGHFTNIDHSNPFIGGLNNMIYAFHMPVFIFISGYFSKNITRQRLTEIDMVLYPFIVFQLIYYIFISITNLGRLTDNLFIPIHQNWYLLGVFFWRLLIPYAAYYPKKTVLTAAVIMSFVIGFIPEFNDFLGLYRIIYFFPFFILWSYAGNLLEFKKSIEKFKMLFIVLFILSISIIFVLSFSNPQFNSGLSIAFTPFKGYNGNNLILASRVFGFIASAGIGFFFLFLIPEKKMTYTKYGPYTINVFLMHMLLVWPLHHLYKELNTAAAITAFIITALLITYFLSQKYINLLLQPFINLQSIKALFAKKKS